MLKTALLIGLSLPIYGFSAEYKGYQTADRCFSGAQIESVSTVPAHDEKNADYAKNLYFGVTLRAKGSSGAIVFVKAEAGTPTARVMELAAARPTGIFTACFEEATAKELKAVMKDAKSGPRYEHQVAVPLVDAELTLPAK